MLKKGKPSKVAVDVTRLAAPAPSLLAGLPVGSSGHGVFKAGLGFGEEGRGCVQRLISAELAFSPPPCTQEKEWEDDAGHRESPGSAAALRK